MVKKTQLLVQNIPITLARIEASDYISLTDTAIVRNGEAEQLLTENQSIFIPIGGIHSLENPGKIPLELIEVQTGPYPGEDDIVRFEDHYESIDDVCCAA